MVRRRVIPFEETPQHVRPDSTDYERWGSVPLMAYDPDDGLVPPRDVAAVVGVVDWDVDGGVVVEPPAVGALAGGEGAFNAN